MLNPDAIPCPIPITAADVIAAHAGRDFGSTGLREVTLTVFTKDEPVISYEIIHVWRVGEGPSCSSLFLLTEPAILSGTALTIVERPYAEDLEIWLRLRTASKPIRVDSSSRDQTVLGTDFTYSDLRFWLPTDSLESTSLECNAAPESEGWLLTARQRRARTGPINLRVVLDRTRWLPVTIEWLDSGGPQRIYRVGNLVCVDEVWTPQVITVTRPRDQYRSVMTLRRAMHRVPVGRDLFLTENLAQLSKSHFDGWIGGSIDS
jgi:hypothetical protein